MRLFHQSFSEKNFSKFFQLLFLEYFWALDMKPTWAVPCLSTVGKTDTNGSTYICDLYEFVGVHLLGRGQLFGVHPGIEVAAQVGLFPLQLRQSGSLFLFSLLTFLLRLQFDGRQSTNHTCKTSQPQAVWKWMIEKYCQRNWYSGWHKISKLWQ